MKEYYRMFSNTTENEFNKEKYTKVFKNMIDARKC